MPEDSALLAAPPAAAPTLGARLRAAEELRRAGKDAGAAEAYRDILATEPTHLASLLALAQLSARSGGPAASRELLERAVAAHPTHGGARLELAEALRATGRLDAAEQAYRQALDTSPAHAAGALLGLARIARARQEPALELFRAALARNPSSLGLRLEVAQELARLGRAEEAETAYRAVLELSPSHLGALLALGQAARGRGDREAALAHFEAAVAARPDHPGARLELGHELRDASRLEEAASSYRVALAAGPALAVAALIGLAQVARRRGAVAEAEALLERAVAEATATAATAARLELAHLRRDTGRLDLAEQDYRATIAAATARQAAAAEIGLGQLYRQRGDRAAALLHFEAALCAALPEGGPPAVAAALELAAELRDRGAYAEAARILDGVLAADPTHLPALLQRGLLARAQGDRAAALAAFTAASRAHPRHAQPLVEAALEHRGLGDPEAAAQTLARARALDPAHLGTRLHQAELLWLAEDAEGALSLCQAIAADRPDCLQARLDAARALAQLGRGEEALVALDATEAEFGLQPAIALRRAELLAQSGDPQGAAALLSGAAEAAPAHVGLWIRRAQALLAIGALDEVAAMLADPAACPAQTMQDHAAVALLRGQLADARWQPEEALAHQMEALRLNPLHAGAMSEAARSCLLLMDPEGAGEQLEASIRAGAAGMRLRGLLPRASQHHLGQILDEFRLDPLLVAHLAALRRVPAAERVGQVLEAVREAPESTPAAIALMLALRQAGLLDRAVPEEVPEGLPTIPRQIGQYWDAAEPPGDVQALMATWPAGNPGCMHRVFDDAGARRFLLDAIAAGSLGPEVLRAYTRAPMAAQKADLFRLAWLATEGGFWLDADDRCTGPLSALHPAGATLVLYQEEYATLGNNMMGAEPGHPVILRALARATEAVNRGDADVVWLSTGPGLLTRAFAEVLAEGGTTESGWFARCVVLERGALTRSVARHCRAAYKATDSHWLRAMAAPSGGTGR